MNEKKQQFYEKQNEKSAADWEQLFAMVSSLQNRAKLCGAFALFGQLESIKKTIMRSKSNKKLIRAIQSKIERLQSEIAAKER